MSTLKDLSSRAADTDCNMRQGQPNVTEPNGGPRQSVVAEKRAWRVRRSFQVERQHISLLELEAILVAIEYGLEIQTVVAP